MPGCAQMCRRRKGDRGLSCQPPAITLPLGKLSKCRGRKDVWGIGESCPAALKPLRCLKYCLSSAEGFSCLCQRTLDQPREKKPLLVPPHLVWELHLRRGLILLLLPQGFCHRPSACQSGHPVALRSPRCGSSLQPPLDLLSQLGSSGWADSRVQVSSGSRGSSTTSPHGLSTGCLPGAHSAAEKQVRAGPIPHQPLQETEQCSEDGQGHSFLFPSRPDGCPACRAQWALSSLFPSG